MMVERFISVPEKDLFLVEKAIKHSNLKFLTNPSIRCSVFEDLATFTLGGSIEDFKIFDSLYSPKTKSFKEKLIDNINQLRNWWAH